MQNLIRATKYSLICILSLSALSLVLHVGIALDPLRFRSPKSLSHIFVRSVLDGNENIDRPVETLFVGSSAMSSGAGGESFNGSLNLAMWGTSPYEGKKVLERYLKKYGEPKRIFVGYNYAPRIYRDNWLPGISLVHRWYGPIDMIRFLLRSHSSFLKLIENSASYAQILLGLGPVAVDYYQKGLWTNNKQRMERFYSSIRKENGATFFVKPAELQSQYKFRPWHSYVLKKFEKVTFFSESYSELATYLAGLKSKVYLLIPPKSVALKEARSLAYLQEHERMLEKLAAKGENIEYLRSPLFMDDDLFVDRFHLNQQGLKYFNSVLPGAEGRESKQGEP